MRLTAPQARRVALAAQGFADPRPSGRVDIRHIRRVMDRVAVLQIDSVNVLERSHYLPVLARLGPYPRTLLDEAAHRRRELFEYWFHAASYGTAELIPLMRPRMETVRPWPRVQRVMDEHPDYIEQVYEEVARRGPLTNADLADPGRRTGPWWGMGRGATALEWLYVKGRLAISHRPRSFARIYDLAERVYPSAAWRRPIMSRREALHSLTLVAARALGIATVKDLADYFRVKAADVRRAIIDLETSGKLVQVEVEGWRDTAYMDTEARIPRRLGARALLSPFDSLIWERDRTERLFGFRYRIEIYVPKTERVFGYYVLPFLLGDGLAARVDLKSDRQAGVLVVQAAHREPGHRPGEIVGPLAGALVEMADWLGLGGVAVRRNGDLSGRLAGAVETTTLDSLTP